MQASNAPVPISRPVILPASARVEPKAPPSMKISASALKTSKKALETLQGFLRANTGFNPYTHMVRDNLKIVHIKDIFNPSSLASRVAKSFRSDKAILDISPEADLSRFQRGPVKKVLIELEKKSQIFVTHGGGEPADLTQSKFWEAFAEPTYEGL